MWSATVHRPECVVASREPAESLLKPSFCASHRSNSTETDFLPFHFGLPSLRAAARSDSEKGSGPFPTGGPASLIEVGESTLAKRYRYSSSHWPFRHRRWVRLYVAGERSVTPTPINWPGVAPGRCEVARHVAFHSARRPAPQVGTTRLVVPCTPRNIQDDCPIAVPIQELSRIGAGAPRYHLSDRRDAAPRSHWVQGSSSRAADRGVPRDVLWVMSVEHHGLTVFSSHVRSSCPRLGPRCPAVARDEL